jgi:methionyl-tRNA synthetase
MPQKKNVLVTTSIAYSNGEPHVGFAMECIQADAYARWNRNRGNTVFFLTGTDDHGSKIFRTAEKQSITPQELTDKNSGRFQELIKTLNISHDDFIRTTQERHKKGAKELWKRIDAHQDFLRQDFEGLYCSGCEAFLTEKELVNGNCPYHLKPPDRVTEENIFFRLSRYSQNVAESLESGKIRILPDFRKTEILQFAKDGLKDVSFSRPRETLSWGVEVPGDPSQVMYVWCDALSNYITAVGFGANDEWKKYWEEGEVIHFIGKDILRFHAGIWPAMLMSADLPLPQKIAVHGFLTSEGHKMSKSLGNVVDPFIVVDSFGGDPDPLRYFLLAEVPFGRDADYSQKRFLEIYNAKLANGLGNLLSRVLTLSKKAGGVLLSAEVKNPDLKKLLDETPKKRRSIHGKYRAPFRSCHCL